MLAWIYVTDNPYAVAVDADGHFTIDDISPGTYTVKAWHPYLGTQEQEITLSAKETSEIAFQFSSNYERLHKKAPSLGDLTQNQPQSSRDPACRRGGARPPTVAYRIWLVSKPGIKRTAFS